MQRVLVGIPRSYSSTSRAIDLTLGETSHPLSPSSDVPAKEREVKKQGKARTSWRRGRSGEEVGSGGRRENKQKTECQGGKESEEGGRIWLSALKVFNCLHRRQPQQSPPQTLHLTHSEHQPIERMSKTDQTNKVVGWVFDFERNKSLCHLETSQNASRRFVAPKKAQNAHGGAWL